MPRSTRNVNSMAARRRASLRAVKRRRQREKLFAIDGQKAGQFSSMFTTSAVGGEGGNKRNYQSFAREAYMRCVIAYRCVYLIARGIGSLPWFVSSDGEIVEDNNEPLTKLLRRPNPTQGTAAFFEDIGSWILLAGNAYPNRITSDEPRRGGRNTARTLELWSLRPDRVTVNVNENTMMVESYTYEVGNKKVVYPVDPITMQADVLQLKTFNPINDYYGLSTIEPTSYGVDQHNAGNEWNYRLLKNSGKPSGAIVHEPGESGMDLSDEQRDRLKRQMRDRTEGELNAGKTLLLEGYLKWQQMGMSPMDMDFANTMASAARQIAAGYGVPPMLVGIPGDATYANYKEARLALWEDTITPLAVYIRDELNNWMVDGFGDDVLLDFDLDAVPALAEKRVALWEKLTAATFLKLNEKREGAGYDEIEGGDLLLVPAGMIPIEAVEEDQDDGIPEGAEDMDPDEAGKMAYGR